MTAFAVPVQLGPVVVAAAATVHADGTENAWPLLDRLTTVPTVGACWASVTVIVAVAPGLTCCGLTETEVTDGGAAQGVVWMG